MRYIMQKIVKRLKEKRKVSKWSYDKHQLLGHKTALDE